MGPSKKVKEEKPGEVESDKQDETTPGVTWQNPGEFPEFQGKPEEETPEEKRAELASSLHSRLKEIRYVRMPEGREKPSDEVFGKVFRAIEDALSIGDSDSSMAALREAEVQLVDLERKVRAEFEAEAKVLKDEVEELRGMDTPEGKFKFPSEVFDELIRRIDDAATGRSLEHAAMFLRGYYYDIKALRRLIGELDKEVGEKLWALYSDPEISVGVHGTDGGRDTGFGTEDGPIMKYGIGCFYQDVRRTVSFQDRGRIHAHGEQSFLDILNYSFGGGKRTTRELKIEEGEGFVEGEEVPASQYTAIVAIPKECSTSDLDVLLTEKRIPVIIKNHTIGRPRKMARAIKPEFIVGVVQDGRVNDIVWNSKFSADHVRELSRKQAKINEEKAREKEEKDRLEEQERLAEQKERESKKLGSRLKRMFERLTGKV